MYANSTEMVLAFGEKEVISLTDRHFFGVIDNEVLLHALVQASADIDSYLSVRYALPLTATPRTLVRRCCDITRYLLCTGGTSMTDEIRLRYEDALHYLERVADGRTALVGIAPQGGAL